jgi:hypothetical protein
MDIWNDVFRNGIMIKGKFSHHIHYFRCWAHRGADKSLARPGRDQATVTEDFDVHISYLLS